MNAWLGPDRLADRQTIMKWVAILLLAANLAYLGWELQRDAKALVANQPPPLKISAGAGTLAIIDETAVLRDLKPVYGWQTPIRVLAPRNSTQSRKK